MVLVRADAVRPPLAPRYDGPYSVIARSDQYFTLQMGDRTDTVSTSRLKPAPNAATPAIPPRRGRPPAATDAPGRLPAATAGPSRPRAATDAPGRPPAATDGPGRLPAATDVPGRLPAATDVPGRPHLKSCLKKTPGPSHHRKRVRLLLPPEPRPPDPAPPDPGAGGGTVFPASRGVFARPPPAPSERPQRTRRPTDRMGL